MKKFCDILSELTEITEIKEWRYSDRLDRLASGSLEPTPRREVVAPCGDSFRGWILYDGDCRFCTASARRFDRIFRRRGFLFLPLQTNWVLKRLGLKPGAPLEEMRVLTCDGRDIGGADAVILLARKIWWAWPFFALARLPGMRDILNRAYRWIAARRGCNHIACDIKKRRLPSGRFKSTAVWRRSLLKSLRPWIALIFVPSLALLARNRIAPWEFMWLMAGAIFLGCKWLTFSRARRQIAHVRVGRVLGYFFLWPGMDAEKFLSRAGRMPSLPITSALWKTLLGVLFLFGVARFTEQSLLAGWIGMIGIILVLHFGLFHLLAIGWRATGIDVEPIMDPPLRSKSVSEFWGRRWNAAFNRLAVDFVFRPLAHRHGTRIATLAAFLVSGLIHELVISLPAGAGYGLPTAYFFLQGIGIVTERALPQVRGRIFTVVIIAGPTFWLFHPPFVRNVILPFMKAIGAL